MKNPVFQMIIPVLPSSDIKRDVIWYNEKMGFKCISGDKMYVVLKRNLFNIHLQWHADTANDPLLGGSVIKFLVEDIQPFFEEFVERGTIKPSELRLNTAWNTHEFGFYDLNNNAIFIIEEIVVD